MIYFIISFILIGLIGLIAYADMQGRKKCPFCKKMIDKEAIKCPHCQSVLEEGK